MKGVAARSVGCLTDIFTNSATNPGHCWHRRRDRREGATRRSRQPTGRLGGGTRGPALRNSTRPAGLPCCRVPMFCLGTPLVRPAAGKRRGETGRGGGWGAPRRSRQAQRGAPFGPAQKWCAARRISLLSHANVLFEQATPGGLCARCWRLRRDRRRGAINPIRRSRPR
jgi:hypothetical protein